MQENITMPNILWICTDQQRYDTIHALGNEYINTPNLDRLCKEGVAFTTAYSQSPVCTPSRASFLTGLYPSSIHVNSNGNEYFPSDVKLITKRLTDVGYYCGLVGKLHIASAWGREENRVDDGYREFYYSHSPNWNTEEYNHYMRWILEQGYKIEDVMEKKPVVSRTGEKEGLYSKHRKDTPSHLHQTFWCAEKAIDFMKEERDCPWLMSVNIYDPHPPHDTPDEYKNRYNQEELPLPLFHENDEIIQKNLEDVFFQTKFKTPGKKEQENKAAYYGAIELIDEQVGRMLEVLEETGQRENTMIIFTSDHGECLGDHGLSAKGARVYEGSVRVPLIISWKGHFKEGLVCDELVELTDLAPTLAELTGIELDRCNGKSLMQILIGDENYGTHRDYVRCEFYYGLNPFSPYKPEKNPKDFLTMHRTKKFKLVVYHGKKYGELYDLEQDPEEFFNLWDEDEFKDIKYKLIKEAFDASIVICDPGSRAIGRY